MNLGSKIIIILFLASIFSFLSIPKVFAQVASPAPVPCGSTGNPEFNSLRPYQASPCSSKLGETAMYCGNTLTLIDTITQEYVPGNNCTISGNKATCEYKDVTITPPTITIDLSDASLPFMGNTEDVKNSQSASESLDEAEKVNNYVSWYLSGVINKAEDGSSKNTDTNIVNFSGPVNKLLPSTILDAKRIVSIQNSSKNKNHNQIAVCADKKYWIFGPVTPKECYQGNNTAATGEVRLGEWNQNGLGIGRDLTKVFGRFLEIIPGISQTGIANAISSAWNKRTPPLPWADENGKPFANELLYQKAYNEWKGKSCVIFLGKLFCLDWDPSNILVNSEWSELFPYVPLSSTEDLLGQISIDALSSATSPETGVTLSEITFNNQKPAKLYYAHVLEANELAKALQDSFVAKGQDQIGNVQNAPSNIACRTTQVRTNKGDDLFAKEIKGDLKYKASYTCEFSINKVSPSACKICKSGKCVFRGASGPKATCDAKTNQCNDDNDCDSVKPSTTCTKTVYITLSTKSDSPGLDEAWSRLVAGPASVFRKIAPKVSGDAPISCIVDIPGSTTVKYSGTSVNSTGELNLPHVGGISAYFLEGIQTILRPKGFGSSFPVADNLAMCVDISPKKNACPSKCNPDPKKVDMSGVKEKFADLAKRWTGGGNPRIDKFDAVVSAAQNAGVDPIFAVAIWLHESGASNYSGICAAAGQNNASSPYCNAVQDFGVNKASIETKYGPGGVIIADHFDDQLGAFVNLPGFYLSKCKGNKYNCPAELFGGMYRSGTCNPSDKDKGYMVGIQEIYKWLKPGQDFPCYPIAIPK